MRCFNKRRDDRVQTPSLILAARFGGALSCAAELSPYADSAKLADLQLSCLGGQPISFMQSEAYDVASMRCVELCVQTAQIPKESGQARQHRRHRAVGRRRVRPRASISPVAGRTRRFAMRLAAESSTSQ